MEMFKTIKEYPLYSVSTMGRVKKNSDNKILSPSKKPNGYLQINLFTNDGRRKKEYVHRLVAITFVPNENRLPEVNHIDGVRDNNQVSNLEWVTHDENMKKSSLLKPVVVKRKVDGDIVGTFDSIQTACTALGLTDSNISACLHDKYRQNSHKGYTFEFL